MVKKNSATTTNNNNRKRNNKKTGSKPRTEPSNLPKERTVCKFLREGRCSRGDECSFLHSPEAAAEGARAQAIKARKSNEEVEKAASVAFEVAKRKLEMKEEATVNAGALEETNGANKEAAGAFTAKDTSNDTEGPELKEALQTEETVLIPEASLTPDISIAVEETNGESKAEAGIVPGTDTTETEGHEPNEPFELEEIHQISEASPLPCLSGSISCAVDDLNDASEGEARKFPETDFNEIQGNGVNETMHTEVVAQASQDSFPTSLDDTNDSSKGEVLTIQETDSTEIQGGVASETLQSEEFEQKSETALLPGLSSSVSCPLDQSNGESKEEVGTAQETDSNETECISVKETLQTEEIVQPSETSLPPGLRSSLSLFTPFQQEMARRLCEGPRNQRHLFENWSTDPSYDEKKKQLMSKLESVDQSYPDGGLFGYLENACNLLEKSRRGENPLEGWVPSVPIGETFEVGTDEFLNTEKLGLKEVGECGFVLVAGGLGERLGYGDIKIGLPTELATETSYIQFYIETILAFQSRYAGCCHKLPLCIMTSGDTNDKTVDLLTKHNYFGMSKEQITIVQQGKGVPALVDNDAHIARDPEDVYDIQMKPHGHGDIHALLHSHGVAKSWLESGTKWVVFFQDTNGLAFHTLALSLGVSSKLGLIMNSITCPRKAKQAIGAITKLTKGDHQRTINVEYNQLDPLLRASGSDGDVNDETGFSPFPGNINQLLFRLDAYVHVLERTKGVMPEFVNPKYKDANKMVFKKPTRLECMMQDFPVVLEGSEAEKVGFTSLASEMCFSPVKNATSDGVALQTNGTHPGVAATGEADQSGATRKLLRSIGCDIAEGEKVKFSGIEVTSGPDCVLNPSFAACSIEYKKKFPNPSAVKVSGRSSLVLKGEGLIIESLVLDGALVIECEEGATGVIRNLSVQNKGWVKVSDEDSSNEIIKMRGYYINKLETTKIVFKQDGSIEGDYSPETPDENPVREKSCATESKEEEKTVFFPQRPVEVKVDEPQSKSGDQDSAPAPLPIPIEQAQMVEANPPVAESEQVPDLSKPASSEEKEKNVLCGGACIIM